METAVLIFVGFAAGVIVTGLFVIEVILPRIEK